MIALISPAKSLDYTTPLPPLEAAAPRFAEDAAKLAYAAAKLGPKKLAGLMHISDKLAKLNAQRFREYDEAPERPAIHAFAGDVYIGFEVKTLEEPAIAFAQDHLRILSGLYGLLRPLDTIRPYRLEMGTKWAPGRKKDLYQYWGKRVSDLLAADLAESGSAVIVNLASKEYWHVVEQSPPRGARIVSIDFREEGPEGLRFNSFAAKRARGMMARWMCEHRTAQVEGLKGFDSDGYRYVADGSDDAVLAFRARLSLLSFGLAQGYPRAAPRPFRQREGEDAMLKAKMLPLIAASAIALSATTAGAQMAAPAATKATTTKTVTTTTKPAAAPKKTVASTSVTKKTVATPAGRMVTTTTSSGKKITYDCAKPGNKAKTACK